VGSTQPLKEISARGIS